MNSKNMLSPQAMEEIEKYFKLRLASVSRGSIGYEADNALDDFLSDCNFVYVANGGSVIHTRKFCSRSYTAGAVPFSIAYEKGFRTLCPKCAKGSYVEKLLKDRIDKE